MTLRRAPWLALCACLLACGPSTDGPDGGGADAAVGDAAVRDAAAPDGGDAGAVFDGSTPPDGARPDAGADDPAPDPLCASDGCLASAAHVGDYSRETIEPLLDPGVEIDNGYSVWTIRFRTDGREALATVTVPHPIAAPAGGYHVVGNNHGTTGLGDGCALTGTVFGAGLSGLFGARGMIGVALDYPGLGTAGVHPYLVASVEGHAALDALRAAAQLARWLEVPLSGRYGMAGLSQGGHATLAAAARHAAYAPELDVRAFAAAAPASVWEAHWRAGIAFDGPHLVFHALLVYAWAAHYGWDGPALWAAGFDADDALLTRCTYDFTGTGTLDASVPEVRAEIFDADLLRAYESGAWGAYGALAEHFATNRVEPYTQTAPLRIYQGDADVVVPEYATRELVAGLRDGGVLVDYEVVAGGTHLDVAFGYVATHELRTVESLAWIRAALDAP